MQDSSKYNKRQFSDFANRMLQSFKRIEHRKYMKEQNETWEEITNRIKTNQKSKARRIVIYTLSSVASVLLIIGVCLNYSDNIKSDAITLEIINQASDIRGNENSSEIILITSNNSQLTLENNTNLKYDEQGQISSDTEELKQVTTDEKSSFNQIYVPKGKRANITFSDGTKMYVNSGSRVVYPAVFSGDKREIYVDGEVYLDVMRDEKRPFFVKTDRLDVRVLGTSFDVCSYKDDSETSIILVSGKVEVETCNKEKCILSPNERLYANNTSVTIEKVNTERYIAWTQNYMILNKDPLEAILKKLSRYYGQDIVCEKNIASMPISGKLDLRDTLDEVATILATTSYINMAKENNRIILKSK